MAEAIFIKVYSRMPAIIESCAFCLDSSSNDPAVKIEIVEEDITPSKSRRVTETSEKLKIKQKHASEEGGGNDCLSLEKQRRIVSYLSSTEGAKAA